MSNHAKCPLFDIPELVIMITQYLSSYDIRGLMLTCKDMSLNLTPSLWRHAIFHSRLPTEESLIRNRHCIRTISITENYGSMISILSKILSPIGPDADNPATSKSPLNTIDSNPFMPALVNLQQLIISANHSIYDEIASNIVAILNHCPRLERLQVPLLTHNLWEQFLDIISKGLPQLKRLSICGNRDITLRSALECLLLCFRHPQLVDLECHFSLDKAYSVKDLDEKCKSLRNGISMSESSQIVSFPSKISALKLHPRAYYPVEILLRVLVDYLPLLVRLEAPLYIHGFFKGDLDGISKSLCPSLEHVKFHGFNYEMHHFYNFFLSSCSKNTGLKTCHLATLNETYKTVNGYCKPEIEEMGAIMHGYPLKALVEYHSVTLVDIEITEYKSDDGENIQNILSTCGKLKRLWFGKWEYAVVEYKTILSSEWICLDLEELCLHVDFTGIKRNIDLYGGRNAFPLVRKVFSRIGRLTRLEKLSFGWKTLNMSFNGGRLDSKIGILCLEELANLKRLRYFREQGECWRYPSLHKNGHWPLLEEVEYYDD